MLCVDRHERLSADEILNHPWLNQFTGSMIQDSVHEMAAGEEVDTDFGQAYVERLQRLQSKSKFKKAVNAVVWSLRLKKAAVKKAIGKAREEEEAIKIVASQDDKIVKEENQSTVKASNENTLQKATSAANVKNKDTTENENGEEDLNMTIDQIQRLASGLLSTATHGVASRVNSSHASPALISKKSLQLGNLVPEVDSKCVPGESEPAPSQSPFVSQNASDAITADAPSSNVLARTDSAAFTNSLEVAPEKSDNKILGIEYGKVPEMKRMSSSVLETFKVGGGVDYDEFCHAVTSVGMPILATKHVFDVFDQSGTGVVSVTEFMSTMVAFRVDILDAAAKGDDEGMERKKENTIPIQHF